MTGERGRLAEAWRCYAAGRLEEAEGVGRQLVTRNEDDAGAWQLIGLARHDRGKYLSAADALERASLLAPVMPQVRIALAHCYGKLRRRRLATELYLELMVGTPLEAELLLQVAAGLDSLDEPRLAVEACRRAAKRDPDLAQVHYDMGYYAARCGYPPHISEALTRRAIELDPDNVSFRVGLISLLVKLDRFDEASRAAAAIPPRQVASLRCECCRERILALCRQSQGLPAGTLTTGNRQADSARPTGDEA